MNHYIPCITHMLARSHHIILHECPGEELIEDRCCAHCEYWHPNRIYISDEELMKIEDKE